VRTIRKFGPRDEEALRQHVVDDHHDSSGSRHAWVSDYHNHLHQTRPIPEHVHRNGFHDINGRAVVQGDHICVVSMPNDPCPLPAGATGVVTEIVEDTYNAGLGQLWVKWDSPHDDRTLNVVDADQFVILVDY
jgi:hypothetical protein